ncbi:uncharacterized protein LOC132790578 isoform X1 [Drosophila nasuta]|uniref:uncharacterized protein LOC132790578 isoform X1 n=1 Tax=Drosophila nasuta TaxID=42062 RepID=UPI00295E8CD7|nr:uncharacterized protein LOC132790578 isoform X1 [Drosophila nasuta]XP_060655131.1 uncharacterized protein LOC132790578 isoform X1 [Drosophila nasuta]
MPLTMRRAWTHRLLLLLVLLQLLLWPARCELATESSVAPQPARARIKTKAESMASNVGDSFNIRHGRSRAHMLHSSSPNSNSTRLTLVSDAAAGTGAFPLPLPVPTQQSGTGGATSPPVTHKIRKLHKKKINEVIRKSVDKSLGVVRPVKNHRSLAEAEHLQGRPTDVDDADDDETAAALDEVMQLADEIDLENSLVSAYQNVVADVPAQSMLLATEATGLGIDIDTEPTATRMRGQKRSDSDSITARQFVRGVNGDDANYEDSDEDDELLLSTTTATQIATFAPRPAAWQLQQQTRNVARTRLLPVMQSNSSTTTASSKNIADVSLRTPVLNVNAPVHSGDSSLDYRLDKIDSRNDVSNVDDDEDDDDVDADGDEDSDIDADSAADSQADEDVTETETSNADNSTDFAIGQWPAESESEPEAKARSQASTSEGIEMKQINFNYESEAEAEAEVENDAVQDTSEVTMDDGYPPEVLIDDNSKQLVIGDVESDADGDDSVDSNQITADVINARDSKIDLVSKFLQYIEQQHLMGSNCVAGTSLNLGEGVVDRYAQDRFRVEAEVAVNRANMLTRIFKTTAHSVQEDVNLLHASVLSMVEFDDDIFAAGNCFDWNEHPSQPGLFCPFAYRLPPPNLGAIFAKDLAMEYHYLGNTSEWFFLARKNAEKVIARNEQYLKSFHLYSNRTEERIEVDTLAVKYEDGRWSKPYYDCGGGNIWMLTYTVPFFGYENGSYHFKGTSGIDIDLRRVDIDQCPQRHTPGTKRPLNIFAGTDKCKQRTTMCEAIMGLGFRRGSYKCLCRKGFYFPDVVSQHKFFNGSLLEEEYEKLMLGKNSTYNSNSEYECLPCAEGCDSCEDASPCIAALNWPMRTSILALACIVIGLLPPAAWFTFRYQQVKVVRAASPALLRVIALGAFFIYCTNIVMYPNPNLYTCTARIWLREIGFSLTYGALMLKTWRISVIFRVRSAKAVKITDAALLKRLGIICGAIGTCLLVRTLVSPPDVVVGRTADDLKAFLCKTDWWDYTFTSMEVLFLAWGVRLCIMVRKAPSEFNESRFISMAIYNEFLLTCFLNVSMLFLQSPANPDLLYIIFFCHTQLTVTLLLALIFGSKVYIVLRSGKSHQENIGLGAKASGAKFNFRPQVRTFAHPSSVTTSTAPAAGTTSAAYISFAENKLSDQEALEEIRQLSMQLKRIQEMAPPKGVAVMTISSLLDGLKTPGGMMVVAAAATHAASAGHAAGGAGATRQSALPLLALNAEMQKYNQQLQQNNNANNANGRAASVTAASRGSIPTMVLETPPSSATPTPTTAYEERAINTELSGDDFREQLLRRTADGHIICSRCLDASKEHYYCCPPRSTCEQLGSPQQEGSLSFANIKLDCMCSQSEDLDQTPQQQRQRRPTVRTAATNTPPASCKRGARNLLEAEVSISYQICDNCRSKYKLSDSKPTDVATTVGRRRSGSCTQTATQSLPSQARSSELLQEHTDATTAAAKVARSTDDLALYTQSTARQATDEAAAATADVGAGAEAQAVSLGNVSNTSNNSTSQTDKTASSSGGGAGRAKRPDKLVLDLNDRSKYTKEVSV